MLHLLLFASLISTPKSTPVLFGATTQTGTVVNPTTALWTPSTDDMGSPSPITKYTLDIYSTAATPALIKGAIDMGHPTPDSTNTDSWAQLASVLASLPLGIYTAQICAEEGSGVRSCSGMSNPFTRAPAAPSNPVIKQ